MINTRDLELLGADYERNADYYLDRDTGKIYRRTYTTMGGYKPGQVLMTNAETVELVPGKAVTNAADLESSMDLRN